MNSKLILAIVIVALIGVVAATYHSNSGETVINSLGGVQTEPESVTDVAGVESDADSENVLEGSTPLANEGQVSSSGQSSLNSIWNRYIANANSGFSSVASNAFNGRSSSTTSDNGGSNSGNGGSNSGNSGSGTGNSNNGITQGNQSTTNGTDNTDTNSSKITSAQILAIAKNATPEGYSNAQPSIFSTTTVDGVVIYSVRYTVNGEVIGEAEIDGNTGEIVGGAYKDEVRPDVVKNSSSSSSSNSNNTDISNSSQNTVKKNNATQNSNDTKKNSTKKTNKAKKSKKNR
ncbi:MAG: PepSY domain-containing protein [Methanosphaera sp.]|nr:PepSY domain-containing protein [Methanosphaera sp.]